ncbi:MAG: hypothetical protein AAB546_03010, partial [Patescibacteria group bacterium]
VFGLPLFIGLGVMNQQLLRQKAAEPVTPPITSVKTKPTIKPSTTKAPVKRTIPIPSPRNPTY